MSERKLRLVDCDPRWVVVTGGGDRCGISFACPEGHDGCRHIIPFTPTLEGNPGASWNTGGAIWQRTGDTFDTLVLGPSIRRVPTYPSINAALAAGAHEEHREPSLFCALHIFIGGSGGQTPGGIEFCGDSR